jgi:hypothetical protein
MGLVAIRTIKEPPDAWELEVTQPPEWRGRFTSADGETWWSPALGRVLGEHHENPGEARMLGNLRALARGHKLGRLEAVAKAARDVAKLGGQSPAMALLVSALRRLDGDSSFWPVSAGYEPDPVEPESEPSLEAAP